MSRGDVITFSAAINEALTEAMAQDDSVICYGLGVTDPKAVFGTTAGLEARFGRSRVFDMPTSENAMTGVAIGAALGGLRPVMTHQRLDFFLLALDQLVNAAAKWHYMFGSQQSVPITIRLIVGRGVGSRTHPLAEPACLVRPYPRVEGGYSDDTGGCERTVA